MNKQPTTVFVQVDCSIEMPTEKAWYNLYTDGRPAACGRAFYANGHFSFTASSAVSGLLEMGNKIFWLKPLPASIVLSVEEYENIQWKIKELERENKYLIESKDIPF